MTDDNERKKSIENDPGKTEQKGSDEASSCYGISYTPGQSGYCNSTYGFSSDKGNNNEKPDPPKKSGSNKKALTISIVSICIVLLVAILMVGTYMTVNSLADILDRYREADTGGENGGTGSHTDKPSNPIGNVIVYKSSIASPASTDFTEIVAKVEKTVVEINTETVSYKKYYGNYIQSGAGSGVIIGSNEDKTVYYVITNHHVVDSANTIIVRL